MTGESAKTTARSKPLFPLHPDSPIALERELARAAEAARREATGAVLNPVDRPEHEGAVAALRVSLGEGAFAAAWEAGRALSLDEALADALAVEPDEG